jgi:protein TonB
MFEQLLETEPQASEEKNRKSYFIITTFVLCTTLFGALVFSLFAVDLNFGMGEIDMLELIAPVEVVEQKLPEPDIAPKAKPQGGPSQTASRQVNMARLDESPLEIPSAISTAKNDTKARPDVTNYNIGKYDSDQIGQNGSGRGDGFGPGDGTGLGDGTETIAPGGDEIEAPPPPVKKNPVKEKPVVRSMGVVNSIAVSLPLPAIPAAAKVANAAGTVSVQVLVDENGNVISANAVSGNILLRAASEAAARNARFTPAKLSGTPIKISGVINYHFSG